jgi:hypothetical protein
LAPAPDTLWRFTYEDVSLESTGQRKTTDKFVYFGQRDDVAVTTSAPFTTMVGFDLTGTMRSTIPSAASWAASASQPVVGVFADATGNLYLRSSTGQLVSWSTGEGLRHYSRP